MFRAALEMRDDASIVLSGARSVRAGAIRRLPDEFIGQRVAVCTDDLPAFIEVVIALDRTASVALLIPPGTAASRVAELMDAADIDSIISDRADVPDAHRPTDALVAGPAEPRDVDTCWVFTTSGTTGTPKLVEHSAGSLTRSITDREVCGRWGLLFDPARFAGFQVALQSLIRGGSLILPPTVGTPFADQVQLLIDSGCSHLSASPSMWRRLLMHPRHRELDLAQITLGGEASDPQILSGLERAFPSARITQIYASTEAGVGFSVSDGKAGFPASLIGRSDSGVQLRVSDGRLWIRSEGSTARYVGSEAMIRDADGFIDTHDRVEVDGDRAYFRGRIGDVIVVGGTNVDLADVQSALLAHDSVAAAAVRGEPSPMTGSLVVADIVRLPGSADSDAALRHELRLHCRTALPREAVPTKFRFVDEIELTSAGKVKRQ